MKKIINLFLCTVILSACSADTAETTATNATAISTQITEAATTSISDIFTTKTTPLPKEKLVLKPIAGDKALEALECNIITDFWVKNENEFLNKKHLLKAKELCYSNEEIRSEIDRYNKENADIPIAIFIKSPNDISFNGGGTYDFDSDGENESLLCLSYTPSWAYGCHAFIYIDETNSCVLISDSGCSAFAEVLDFGKFRYVSIHSYAGVSSYFNNIYNFKNGINFAVPENYSSRAISYETGIFTFQYKWDGTFPVVCCPDGIFRQLATEKISIEDFLSHVENGDKYLEKLKKEGNEITEIYTCGYLKYWLHGNGYEEHFCISENNSEWYPMPSKEIYITDEKIYGSDVWNTKLIPPSNI